jgi:hypothetical protein
MKYKIKRRSTICSPSAQNYSLLIASIVVLTVSAIVPQRSLASGAEPQNVVHQLRIYQIFDANKRAFHDRFRDHAMRIMAKYDFKIVATSESKKDNRTEFVYLLEWPDKETMADRWKKFLQIRNGLGSRRRRAKLTDRSWERSRIAPCI